MTPFHSSRTRLFRLAPGFLLFARGTVSLFLALLAARLVSGADLPNVFGAKKPGDAATVESVKVQGDPMPGGKVTALVKVKLDPGYHVHSNKPSEPQFIATVVTMESAPGVRVGNVGYPAGISLKVDGLAKPLSVYEREFEVAVPLGLTGTVKLPVVLAGVLRYQACRGAQCYPPRQLKFEIKLEPKP
jgi:DsbC/DsbD-like thiol-disulfide interchange protein